MGSGEVKVKPPEMKRRVEALSDFMFVVSPVQASQRAGICFNCIIALWLTLGILFLYVKLLLFTEGILVM